MTDLNQINFILDTDWVIKDPIDYEHKKYVLLAYFKKVDEILRQDKIYPTFIELSLHLANIQTIIKERSILYTDKIIEHFDEEILLKDLKVKKIENLSKENDEELDKILKLSSSKFFEYFNLVKSYWSVIYETISISLKKNKKNMIDGFGYLTYNEKKTNSIYVWEYSISEMAPKLKEFQTNLKLIYQGNKKSLTFNQIIENFSSFEVGKRKNFPIFEAKTSEEYPLNETLIPLFKRKLLSYVLQSVRVETLRKYEA